MKIKKFMLPIWWYNRGWFPLGNKYLGSSFWMGGGHRSIFWIGEARLRVRKFFGTLCAQSRNIKLCAQSTPQNWKLCMFSSIFMLNFNGFVVPDCFLNLFWFLHYIWIFQDLSKMLGGGGGGQNDMFATPIISLGGSNYPPPPQDRRLSLLIFLSLACNL